MKIVAWMLLAGSIVVTGLCIRGAVLASYEYENKVESYWMLSEKASTIQQKSEYLDKFVDALKTERFAGHNAIWLQTPDNSFVQNVLAVESLQGRMHEIIGMDPSTFQYQTAMQQITQQEMNEAGRMLGVFEGTWYLENHPIYWDWYGVLTILTLIALVIVSIVGVIVTQNSY